jgi:hypothetical protein
MQIDLSAAQLSNADSARIESLQCASNVKFERAVQNLKQNLAICSIDEGRQIDSSDEHFSKADSPSVEIREFGSNVSIVKLVQSLKQDLEIVLTDGGMEIA